mgnify:CR=1|tara:strand:- start:730 stop:1071 length:342 start_codon:yes stop_codon:yes gene_type:complete
MKAIERIQVHFSGYGSAILKSQWEDNILIKSEWTLDDEVAQLLHGTEETLSTLEYYFLEYPLNDVGDIIEFSHVVINEDDCAAFYWSDDIPSDAYSVLNITGTYIKLTQEFQR